MRRVRTESRSRRSGAATNGASRTTFAPSGLEIANAATQATAYIAQPARTTRSRDAIATAKHSSNGTMRLDAWNGKLPPVPNRNVVIALGATESAMSSAPVRYRRVAYDQAA